MACRSSCKLCNKLVISTAVTFANGELIITLPAGSYNNNEKYCIVVAQAIPTTTTIGAPVVIQIGSGTVTYPLTRCDCVQAVACNIRTRTRYETKVETSPTGGTFRLIGKVCCSPDNSLNAIDGIAPATPAATVVTDFIRKEGK